MKKLLNKWVNKQTVVVFILSILLSSTTFVLAESKLKVNVNPYPVIVNGIKINTTGYNINGYTYLKTRDISYAVKLPIDFKDKKIYIGGVTESSEKTTSDGIKAVKFEGKYYVNVSDVVNQTERYMKMFDSTGKMNFETNESYILYKILDQDKNILYEFSNYITVNHLHYININQYENEILPILKK